MKTPHETLRMERKAKLILLDNRLFAAS